MQPAVPSNDSTIQRFNDLTRRSHFPRNRQLHFAQYTSERPELISHGEKSKKAKTTKEKL